MPPPPFAIPPPSDTDSEDVHWALSAATSLSEQGDGVEALKWLRRAANAAADKDADARAVELFKAAADLASILEQEAPKRPTASPRAHLPALRVAVVPIPEDRDVRLIFLPPDARAPRGMATAWLVAPSVEDAELLAEVVSACTAKL